MSVSGEALGFHPNWPLPQGVHSFVSFRMGGCSEPPYDSNNLGLHVGDNPESVEQNRRQLMAALGVSTPIQWLRQVHGNRIVDAKGDSVVREGDGTICADGGTVCSVLTADCLPVLLTDRRGRQVAAVHGGWRGLADNILANAVKAFTCLPSNIQAYLGPAICQQCYEVDEVVRSALLETIVDHPKKETIDATICHPRPHKPGHFLVSIAQIARLQLQQLGVRQIYGGDICNACDSRFYSHRRDTATKQNTTGRFASLIWIS